MAFPSKACTTHAAVCKEEPSVCAISYSVPEHKASLSVRITEGHAIPPRSLTLGICHACSLVACKLRHINHPPLLCQQAAAEAPQLWASKLPPDAFHTLVYPTSMQAVLGTGGSASMPTTNSTAWHSQASPAGLDTTHVGSA